MSSRFLSIALVLGLLSSMGPFAVDMYLPALPSIEQSLQTDVGMVQMSLMAFFISLGAGQLIYGSLSDMFGRKPPLYVGLCLFALGSVGCALAANIHHLILWRFVQGLGACAGVVIPRAIVRDMHTGHAAARLMSLLMLVYSVSPILAPLTGSMVIRVTSWRGIFWLVTIVAGVGLLLLAGVLKETRPAAQRVQSTMVSVLASYRLLLRDRHFLGLVFAGAFGFAGLYAYMANSSFVLINYYGLTPTHYSLAFSVNALAYIGASQFIGSLGARYGLKRVLRAAVLGNMTTTLLLLALTIGGVDQLAVMMSLLFVSYGFLGLMMPSMIVLALDLHGPIAGTAAAVFGTLQCLIGALVIAVIGRFIDGTPLPMVAGITGCATIAFTLIRITLRERRPQRADDQSIVTLD